MNGKIWGDVWSLFRIFRFKDEDKPHREKSLSNVTVLSTTADRPIDQPTDRPTVPTPGMQDSLWTLSCKPGIVRAL